MKRQTSGAFALLILGLAAVGAGWFFWPKFQESRQVSTSDAVRSKGAIRVGIDNFVGYFPLCSPHMRRLMLADGWQQICIEDDANYVARFEKLRKGQLDFAVATVDTAILAGMRTNFPGVIIAVIDESKGADAMLARKDAVSDLTALKSRFDLKVAYTPDSPSHHFLKAIGVHFDVPLLRSQEKGWRIETKGSTEACQKLISGEAQVAVCWEPDVSQTLGKPGIVKLLGSEQTSRLIVDVLLVNRDYLDRNPDRVKQLLGNYFKALKHYRDEPDALRREVAQYAKVSEQIAVEIVKGVSWVNLNDNALVWFGVPQPGQPLGIGLFETIESTVRILKEFGDVSGDPLPNGDPRRITNSAPITLLYGEGVGPVGTPTVITNPLEAAFSPLDEQGWKKLREVGALKIPQILFQSGSDTLALSEKEQLDEIAEILKSYPHFRIEVQGHTKTGGDEAANLKVSNERAEAVVRYLLVTFKIDPNRVRVVGFGSSKPLPQRPGEPFRAYRDRLARVEIRLKTEVY